MFLNMLVCTDIHNVPLALGQIGLKEPIKVICGHKCCPKKVQFSPLVILSKVPGASEAVPAEEGTGGEEAAAGAGGPGEED